MALSMARNFGLSANTLSTYPRRYVLPMTKLILAATTALKRQVAVPGINPNRYPEDAVRMGTAGIARISARISERIVSNDR